MDGAETAQRRGLKSGSRETVPDLLSAARALPVTLISFCQTSPVRDAAADKQSARLREYNESMTKPSPRPGPRPAQRSGSRRASARRSSRRPIMTLLSLSVLAIETVAAILLLGFLVIFSRFSDELPSIEAATGDIKAPVSTTVWSEDGVRLGQLDTENRQPIDLKQMPKDVVDATIAIEDHRFWEHPGIDVQGIARAILANLRGSRMSQGASTLTQQLVRQPVLASQFGLSSEKKLSRKIREALIALRVEQLYSKKEILQLYLNNVYYGAGAYGIQAASLTYFGKSARKLSIAEAALLAGLPQRPNDFMPFEHRKLALRRRDEVLNALLNYGYISVEKCEAAKSEPVHLGYRPERKTSNFLAPYFTTYVLEDIRRRYGQEYLYGGLKIETTLNWKIQKAAEAALEKGLKSGVAGANQGAVVAIDNRTGYIRAMVGGRNYRASKYNAITQGHRQPGSTFKLFDYAAAFDTDTLTLHSTFRDIYFAYPGDSKHRGVDGETQRTLDLRTAIALSSNSVALQVAQKVGIRTIIDYAHKMGITTRLDPYLPTAIGATAVRPLDLCSAYTIVPMKGARCIPMAIVRVTDAEGALLEENIPNLKQDILKPSTIEQLDDAFLAVVTHGTGRAARGTEGNGVIEDARGKTGTTNDGRDVWFAGYTPELTAVFWAANVAKHGRRIVYRPMPSGYGGVVCAPMWHDFMVKAQPIEKTFKLTTVTALPLADQDEPDNGDTADQPERRTRHARRRHTVAPAQPADPGQDGGQTDPGMNGDQAPDPGDTPTNGAPSQGETPDAPPPDSAPPAPVGAQNAAPEPRPPIRVRNLRPPAARVASSETISVRVCVDTGLLANSWCPETRTSHVAAAEAGRMRRCRVHHAPPGEQ